MRNVRTSVGSVHVYMRYSIITYTHYIHVYIYMNVHKQYWEHVHTCIYYVNALHF